MSTDIPTMPASYDTDISREPEWECPPSSVVDMIVCWPKVREGDLVLWDGEFRLVERINPMDDGNHAVVLDDGPLGGVIPVGTYAAVRRYVEG